MGGVLDLAVRYCPHGGQRLFHGCGCRFRVVAPGRRWGKTTAGANEAIRLALSSPRGSVGYVVAPSYSSSSLGRCWDMMLQYAPPEVVKEVHGTPGDKFIRFRGNRVAKFRSAEAPTACKGDPLSWAWFDEPAEMGGEIWDVSVLPSLIDHDGRAIFTGTPKGSNWYRFLFLRGQDQQTWPDYWSHGGSSYENTIENGGYLKKESIDKIAENMSERARQQEILGMFLDDVGMLFRNVKDHLFEEFKRNANLAVSEVPWIPEVNPDMRYCVGADVAKHSDWTVLTAWDTSGRLAGFDRFQEVDWHLQQKRITEFSARFNNARALIDSQGPGDPVYDNLRAMGCNVEGYKFTNASKADLVENYSIMLENSKMSYPNIPAFINEMQIFGYSQTAGGTTVYSAPEGYHDDCVISAALGAWMLREPIHFDVDFGKAVM